MTPIITKNTIIFPAIGSANQLTDVLGLTEPQIKDIDNKIEYVADNIKRVEKVNGTKIYYPEISGKDIFYQLSPELNTPQYYYPIQYAKIEINLIRGENN